MYQLAKPLFLIVETPLHAGSGTDLGIVDLPIQREGHTNFPKIEASSLKGSMRGVFVSQPKSDQIEAMWNIDPQSDDYTQKAINLAFGPDTGGDHAAALGFTDARLLLFPVKSVRGVFAWITCPAVLSKFKQDLSICQANLGLPDLPDKRDRVPADCDLMVDSNKVVLEEYTFGVQKSDECTQLAEWIAEHVMPGDDTYAYWREKVKKSLIVLSDNDFQDFVTQSTEVIARIKINQQTGTVQEGALWYEEYLPSESILYSLALTSPVFVKGETEKGIFAPNEMDDRCEARKVMDFFEDGLPGIIQIGGNASTGKGLVRTHIPENGGGGGNE